MSDTLTVFTDGWNQLAHSPLWVVIAVMTLAIGLTLKSIKVFPNRFIPLVTMPFATIAYALLGNPGEVNPYIPYPKVMLAFYGFIDGFVAWASHRWILKRFEKYLPWLAEDFQSDPPFPNEDKSNVRKDLSTPADPPKTGI